MRHQFNSKTSLAAATCRRCAALLLLLSSSIPTQEISAHPHFSDSGDFKLQFHSAVSRQDQQTEYALRAESTIESLINDVNKKIGLTRNVTIVFAPWELPGRPNAVWDSDNSQIVIGYSLVGSVMEVVGMDFDSWNPIAEQIVMHEIAHALFEINRMPNFDDENEELLADSLAFFYLSAYYPEDHFKKVARYYESRPRSENLGRISEHLPDENRAGMYRCWSEGYLHWRYDHPSQCADDFENLRLVWEERLHDAWK